MIIRPFTPADLQELQEVSRCFPAIQRKALNLEGLIYVAEDEGKLLGAIKGRLINTPKGLVGGILWLMIHPDHQSHRARSITKPLMDQLLSHFDDVNTRWQIACVDLGNLPSSRGVEHFGFVPAGLRWTWKTFGLSWPKVAYRFWHLVDIGQILWVRGEQRPTEEGWLDHILLLFLFTLPWWILGHHSIHTLGLALGVVILRDLPQHLIALRKKEAMCFRGFDSALLPALMLSCLGQWFPYFGVWTPKDKDHPRKRSPLARSQMAGLLAAMMILFGLGTWGPLHLMTSSWHLLLSIPIYLLAEFIIPTFPFKGSIANRSRRK